ncbi:MAG TPA: metal-dependent hydrolase [Solirubrobacterales bacterium]|jgi:L-ascorbate metabolism protein UlaG (beta-lactamase superfamily)|nr:metal-dependent hydrolase [Solirubrobacterales bacterium]
MEIRFHGHSCFELIEGETRVLVDPFLKPNNPAALASAEDVDPTHIAITHGHVDHMADAVGVATRTGAECVAIVEIANWLEEQGVEQVNDPNLGGTVRFDWGWIKLVPAWHTSTIAGSAEAPYSPTPGTVTGTPAGLLINLGEVTVYHAGDTCLFGDMKLIAERNPVDVALLPIGGHYTMDRHDGVVAAAFIGAGTVIPMHFDTFPPVETDSAAFKAEVEAKTSSSVVVLAPGESHSTG